MPQIVEYVNREGITPTDRGIEARVQQGRRIGASFNEVAEGLKNFGARGGQMLSGAIRDAGNVAVAYAGHREINQGIDTYWQIRSQKENEWQDIAKNADPHDPTVAQRFMTDNLGPALEKWSETFYTEAGQNFAKARVSSLMDHMSEKTAADMGTLAADQVDTSLRRIFNNAGNIAYRDPSAVPHLMDDVRSSVESMINSSPNLKGAAAARARMEFTQRGLEGVVKNGVQGAIATSNNPEAVAKQWSSNPRYTDYFSGSEANQLAKAAATQARVNRNTELSNERYIRERANDQTKIQSADVMRRNVTVDPNTNKVTINPKFFQESLDLLKNNPQATDARTTAEALLNWGQREMQERQQRVISDPVIKQNLYDGIFSSDNPTSTVDILNARAKDQLDRDDAANLFALSKAVKEDPESSTLYKEMIPAVRGLLGNDPKGNEAYAKFASAFFPTFRALPPEQRLQALNMNDPNSLISRTLEPYRRSPLEIDIAKKAMGLELSPETMEGIRNMGAAPAATPQAVPRQPTRAVTIPSAAIQMLKNNPTMSGEFDQKYGRGEAAKILGTK